MKAHELVLLFLVAIVAVLVVDLWAQKRADEKVKAILATTAAIPVIAGFAAGAVSA